MLLNYALGPKSQRLKHKDICEKGTAPFMDAVVLRAKARGYQYWRTMTTGKSFGIPLDIYGLLDNGDLFCLIKGEKQAQGTRLFINGKGSSATTDMDSIYQKIGEKIQTSGMTTTGVMACFRTSRKPGPCLVCDGKLYSGRYHQKNWKRKDNGNF